MITPKDIALEKVPEPDFPLPQAEPRLPDAVYDDRLSRTVTAMAGRGLDYLVVYADREHYSTFDWLLGFGPRFEEAILVIRADGAATVLLGNECYGLHRFSRIPVTGRLYQVVSLPNQPICSMRDLADLLGEAGVATGKKVGVVGWKLMAPMYGGPDMFDVPHYIVECAKKVAGNENVANATDIFIHPGYGVRTVNGADEIAWFEYGAAWAGAAVQNMLAGLQTGMTELDVTRLMNTGGMPVSCHPLCNSGYKVDMGLVSPTTNPINLGDPFCCSQGLLGGLTCRAGFAAYGRDDLPEGAKDYFEVVAAPYYATVANWYETIGVDVGGGSIFDMVQSTYPKEKHGWTLNPGHLIGTEEWLSSPIYPGSEFPLRSGMCLQMDIIPAPPAPYAGANCEDGVALADEALRKEIENRHPDVWARIQARRNHMTEALGIKLKPEVLPLSNLAATYRPYMLNKDMALVVKRS